MFAARVQTAGFLIFTQLICSAALSAEQKSKVSAALELFTSQGCSSCPPGDRLLETYARRPDIVALSFPVDYWDYLGWKDTLANHQFTDRQKAYAGQRGDRQIYTPQMVVNGRRHAVGSDKTAIDAAIAESPPPSVPIDIKMKGDEISVMIGAPEAGMPTKGTLWLALYDRHIAVPVGRGENSGRMLDYYNVVRKLRRVAMWKGDAMSVALPMSEYREAAADGCAILLQEETPDGTPGAILGAARADRGEAWE